MATNYLDEETAKKVIRQVEFYFSDSNLPRDNFLANTVAEREDGMVSLALICSFARMRGHLDLGDAKPEEVPEDKVKAVAQTLKNSLTLRISEDGKKVGRIKELPKPEEVIEQLDIRTIAASPIAYDAKLEDVESFFGQFAKVNSVRLPRHVADKRLFCGTALIEFSAEEDTTRILTQSLIYGGANLELKPKKDFDAERAKEEDEASRRQTGSNGKTGSPQEAFYPKGLIVAFTLKSISSAGEPSTNGVDVQKMDVGPDASETVTQDDNEKGSDNVEKSHEEESVDVSDVKVDDKSGLESEEAEDSKKPLDSSLPNDEDKVGAPKSAADKSNDDKDIILREDLKKVFGKFGTVKYIDFSMGEESGYIRFEEEEGSQKARAAAVLSEEGGLIVKNRIATLEPLTGDAEKEYWSKLRGNQQDKYDKSKASKENWNRGGGRQNRGGGRRYNGKHQRSRENDSGSRPNKFHKV